MTSIIGHKCSKLLLTIIILSLLQGCMTSSVVSTGAQAVYNRHNLRTTINDHYQTLKADRAIHWYSDEYKNCNLAITTFNNMVLMTGQISSASLRKEAEKRITKTTEADHVYNFTTVGTPISSLTHMSDLWITTKIQAQLIAQDEIDPSTIKVITENGIVYLMGILFRDQADIAVEIARDTEGVEGVVKIFSYLRIYKR